jgi:hypothetical protein
MRRLISIVALCLPFTTAVAQVREPSIVRAGSLTVSIPLPAVGNYGAGGLADFKTPGTPVTVDVEIRNSGSARIAGTVRLQLTDKWSADPAGPVAFSVAAKAEARVPFRVQFAEGTYNSDYPIHAYVEFEEAGRKLVAHPILLVLPRQSNPPRANPAIEWKPFPVAANGALALWRLPLHREHVRVEQSTSFGAAPNPVYETQPAIAFSGLARRPAGGRSMESITVRLGPNAPSMRDRIGWAATEFPLQLPASNSIRLRFSTAKSGSLPAPLARVRLLPSGEVLFEGKPSSDAWQDSEVDLQRFAGQAISLQFEADAQGSAEPGQVNFGEPVLLTGKILPASAFPPEANQAPKKLGSLNGHDVLIWPGRRGILDATIAFAAGRGGPMFHGLQAEVLDDALEDPRSTSELITVREESTDGAYRLRHSFRSWAGDFDLLSELKVEAKALRCRVWLENAPAAKPWLSVYLQKVSLGAWNEKARRIYGGVGNVLADPQRFSMNFDGHNLASSYVGFEFPSGSIVEAVDTPPDRLRVDPATSTYTLDVAHSQTITLIPAANVWEGVRTWRDIDTRRASAGVPKLAGRFVFDLWSGRYGEGARALEQAFRYGLTDAAVVWHNWQRWGYDYRLPDIFPPSPEQGTLEEFRHLADVCKQNGVLFAPHDNYIDFYPDADGFSYSNIAFTREGQPHLAWFRYGPNVQSYRSRPDRLRPFVERNLKLIRDGFAPTAYFIDVWSSISPYDYWTSDGQFIDRTVTRRSWGETFAWIRDYLGNNAPQISEAGHDQLIGWLDGAQAQHLRIDPDTSRGFTLHVKAADAERIPWLDAAYHDRFILHGAGYPDRYAGELDAATHGIYSDDYIATEVLTGHPAMVANPFGRDVVRKYWLLHDLMRALAGQRIESVEFVNADIHHQHVRWANGGDVWVNRGTADWNTGDRVLPPYGFYAHVPGAENGLTAAIERKGGVVVEWSAGPGGQYLHERGYGVGYRLTRDGQATVLTPLPESEAGLIRISKRLAMPAAARQAQALDMDGHVLKTVPVTTESGEPAIHHERGVFAYRLEPAPAK